MPAASAPALTTRNSNALWRRLQPLATPTMPLDVAPPRSTRFGSPLVLSRVHWVRPELVAEVKYLAWTEDNLLRQVVYEGLREDKPAAEVRRSVPHPKPIASTLAARSTLRGPGDKRSHPLHGIHSLLILPPPVAAVRRRNLVLPFSSVLSRFEAAVRQAFPIDGDPGPQERP